MSGVTPLLAVAALVAGVTGAWSPCGFSMVETLAPHGYAGRLRTTLVACVTFTAGALGGGVATFGGLALAGAALGAAAPAVAAAVALAAAVGEATGARILPQVRRQVPERWRRVLPVPLAAGLYGILLGLGFTTFILTFAVWALAGISVALGDPALGAWVGLAFGAGRALPVVALAPSGGGRAAAAMAERPRLLRALRALDAAALAACAAALWAGGAQARAAALPAQAVAAPAQARAAALPARAGAMPAGAARVLAAGVADPSVDGKLIALHRPGGVGELRSPQQTVPAPGPHPAVGGGHLAWVGQGTVEVQGLASYPAPGADAVAVSRTWVAWRAGTALHAARIGAAPRVVATGAVSRPALDGSRLVFAVAGRIDEITLASGRRRTLRREARVQLRGPSALGGRLLLYVRADYRGQQLMLGRLRPRAVSRDRVLYGTVPTGRRDSGADPGREHAPGHNPYLWPRPRPGVADTLTTTALAHRAAYVTRVRQVTGRPVTAVVLRIAR